MAKYNEINVGRWNRFLTKLTGIKGPAPAPQLATEVQIVHPIFHGPENRYLEGWEIFALSANIPAGGAGNFTEVQIRNPTGSNVIAVVFKISAATNAADFPILQYGQPGAVDLLTSQQANVRSLDSRSRPSSTLIASSGTPVGQGQIGSNIWQGATTLQALLDDVVFDENQEIPILPGTALRYVAGIANQSAVVTFWWRERFLEEGERT